MDLPCAAFVNKTILTVWPPATATGRFLLLARVRALMQSSRLVGGWKRPTKHVPANAGKWNFLAVLHETPRELAWLCTECGHSAPRLGSKLAAGPSQWRWQCSEGPSNDPRGPKWARYSALSLTPTKCDALPMTSHGLMSHGRPGFGARASIRAGVFTIWFCEENFSSSEGGGGGGIRNIGLRQALC